MKYVYHIGVEWIIYLDNLEMFIIIIPIDAYMLDNKTFYVYQKSLYVLIPSVYFNSKENAFYLDRINTSLFFFAHVINR